LSDITVERVQNWKEYWQCGRITKASCLALADEFIRVSKELDELREVYETAKRMLAGTVQERDTLREQVRVLSEALLPLSKYLAGGHYEPRTEEEGKLAGVILEVLATVKGDKYVLR
jgi:hypothetical protein